MASTTSHSAAGDQLTVNDATASRAWLDLNEDTGSAVWLTLAKKGTRTPTSLTYQAAPDEALCSGWIDGRKNTFDAATYRQHFTPRRARSLWSRRNVDLCAGLIEAGRMHDRGRTEIERARSDGRWERAYAGAATIGIPEDLLASLQASPTAQSAFLALGSTTRYQSAPVNARCVRRNRHSPAIRPGRPSGPISARHLID